MDIEMLRKVPLFADLDDNGLDKVRDLLQKRIYKRNNMILMEEEFGDTLFIINSGRVKITRISEEGKEVILSILGEGEFFGEMSILDGETRSANVIALEDSEVFILKRADFLHLLEQYPRIAIYLLQELAFRLRKSDEHIESLSLSDAENRIALTVLRLAEEMGTIKHGEVLIKKLPYQQDIANMAGTSRETVSRMMKLLEKKGYIKKSGHTLRIPNYENFRSRFK